MIIQIKHGAEQGQVDNLLAWLRSHGIEPHISVGQQITLIGCVGDVSRLDIDLVQALDVVESVQRIQEPY